ncbi:iron-sulfur cluster assembly scaffold protein [Candidatus Dojkabacteria bacterium]|jgi:nitrogen fixation NifU-like protein|nr:iron-sulfur cluster assembly scaffold protein [Candidatus Dojkabacteria bacterium]
MKKDLIIQHYKKPGNWGDISNGLSSKTENVSCGDSVTVFLKVENGVLENAKYTGMGCSICLGSTDILIGDVKGKRVEDILKLTENHTLGLIEMDGYSPRKICAILGFQAVISALKDVK